MRALQLSLESKITPRTLISFIDWIVTFWSLMVILGWSFLWNRQTSVFLSLTISPKSLNHLRIISSLTSRSTMRAVRSVFHSTMKLSSAKFVNWVRSACGAKGRRFETQSLLFFCRRWLRCSLVDVRNGLKSSRMRDAGGYIERRDNIQQEGRRERWEERKRRPANQERNRERTWFDLASWLNGKRRVRSNMVRKIEECLQDSHGAYFRTLNTEQPNTMNTMNKNNFYLYNMSV